MGKVFLGVAGVGLIVGSGGALMGGAEGMQILTEGVKNTIWGGAKAIEFATGIASHSSGAAAEMVFS